MLPIVVQWLAHWPPAAARSGIDVLRRREPGREAPVRQGVHPLAGRHSPWRQRLGKRLHRPVVAQMDRLAEPAWQRRFRADGLEHLTAGLADRPVIALTLHYGAVALLRGYLLSRGIRAAVVVNDRLSNGPRRAAWLPAGSPRGMLEYLERGHCLVIAADFLRGRTVTVPLPDAGTDAPGSMTLSSGPFRLARLSGALVVPVLISERSRWRYSVRLFPPVPDAVLAAGDDDAARHVLKQLWPLILREPGQARDRLVEAVGTRTEHHEGVVTAAVAEPR